MAYKIREDIAQEFISYLTPVFKMGAEKHGDVNWLQPYGKTCSHKEMHDCVFHHVARSFTNGDANNLAKCNDSEAFDLAHAAARCLMRIYTVLHKIPNN